MAMLIKYLLFTYLLLFGGNFLTISSHSSNNGTRRDENDEHHDFCTTGECVKAAGSVLSAMDLSANPCQDFYQYACGGFQLHQNIPAGSSRLGPSTILTKTIMKQLRNLLEEPEEAGGGNSRTSESNSRQKFRRFYKSCIDLEAINRNSILKMREIAGKMGGHLLTGSYKTEAWSLNEALALYDTYHSGGLFTKSISADDKNATENVIFLGQGSLILGGDTRDYFVNKSVTEDPILAALTEMLQTFSTLILGENSPFNRSLVVEVVNFEKKRAEIQQPAEELLYRSKTYTKVNVTWLEENFGFLNWTRHFSDLFSRVNIHLGKNEPVVLFAVPYFRRLTSLVKEYLQKPGGNSTLQNYLILRVITAYSRFIGGDFVRAYDNFQAVFSGKRGSQERWETCLDDVDSFPLGAMFVEKFFSKEAKRRAESVISETIETFRSRIENAKWMDEETRKKALDKFDGLEYKVGYPDWIFNETYLEDRYSKFNVTDDYIQNRISSFNYQRLRDFGTLRETPDRSDWYMTPQTVNAYYDTTLNEVVIPAGILSSPFFYAANGVPSAINFGAVGGIAGHEITHGFDSKGRQYDKFGNLKDWWNAQSNEQFQNRSRCFVEKFDSYRSDGLSLKGNRTLSENIADDGGIKVAYDAYKNYETNTTKNSDAFRKLVGLQELTPDQLFFVGWAQTWCSILTPAARALQILTDSHSPNRFRVIGPLSNFEAFSKAFNCSPGMPMNSPKRCSIW